MLLYWAWFAIVVLLAFLACFLFMSAVLLPVFRMSSEIG